MRFVDYSKEKLNSAAIMLKNERHYCIPSIYDPMPCWLFHNNGDGTFTDVSKESESRIPCEGLGVVAADVNNDGPHGSLRHQRHGSQLPLRQSRKGKFEEIGALGGWVGVSASRVRAMGVDAPITIRMAGSTFLKPM